MVQTTKDLIKKIIGLALIIIGVAAFFTPLTPGSWLAIIGLEMIGVRLLFFDKIKAWWSKKPLSEAPNTQNTDPGGK